MDQKKSQQTCYKGVFYIINVRKCLVYCLGYFFLLKSGSENTKNDYHQNSNGTKHGNSYQ